MNEQLLKISKNFQVNKGDNIYSEGEYPDGIYYVVTGLVGLYKSNNNGRERLIRLYGTGEYFGFRSLISEQKYHLTTKALLPSDLFKIKIKSDLEYIFTNFKDFGNKLISNLCTELKEAENRLSIISSYAAKVKILDSIIFLFSRFPEYHWTTREIGEFSGVETQTVIRFSRELKKRGILDSTSRKVKPIDINILIKYRRKLIDSY